MVDLFRYRQWDLVSKRGLYYAISALVLVIGLAAMIINARTHGEIVRRGIDFTGGGGVTYSIGARLPAATHAQLVGELRGELAKQGITSDVKVSPAGLGDDADQIIVNTQLARGEDANQNELFDAQITETITPAVTQVVKKLLPDAPSPQELSRESVSASISQELIFKGLLAVIIGTLLIMGWIGIRYNIGGSGLRYSVAGVIALLHDLVLMIGLFAVLYHVFEVNSPFIAALLTVLGYSIHDTIVIFDRIRENIRHRKGRTFAETVNISLLETLARSVNTVLTLLFTLLALFFFGGPTLRDFMAAMLIGVTVGTFSSIFIASQMLVSWAKGDERVILPQEAPVPVAAGVAPVAAPVVAAPAKEPEAAAGTSREAIRRARQAGKARRR